MRAYPYLIIYIGRINIINWFNLILMSCIVFHAVRGNGFHVIKCNDDVCDTICINSLCESDLSIEL